MWLKRTWTQNVQCLCRFYFMSDDELLSVLGTSDPMAIQEHMLKLFDNAAALVFDHGCKAVTGMISSEVQSPCLAICKYVILWTLKILVNNNIAYIYPL